MPTLKAKHQPYRAYLLRCWQDAPAAWRFSVEEVRAEPQRRGFRDLDDLVAFLCTELEQGKEAEDAKSET
jgi:hypothetical protein